MNFDIPRPRAEEPKKNAEAVNLSPITPTTRMAVSGILNRAGGRSVCVMLNDDGTGASGRERFVEIRLPEGEVLSNSGYTDGEIEEIISYLNENMDDIMNTARNVNPMKAFMKCSVLFLYDGLDSVEFIKDPLLRFRSKKTYHYTYQKSRKESGQKFIYTPYSSHGLDQVVPDKYHCAAADHSGYGTLPVRSSPEYGKDHDRSERAAESGPCERHDIKYVAVGISCNKYGDDRDHYKGDTGHEYVLFLIHLDAEHFMKDVL